MTQQVNEQIQRHINLAESERSALVRFIQSLGQDAYNDIIEKVEDMDSEKGKLKFNPSNLRKVERVTNSFRRWLVRMTREAMKKLRTAVGSFFDLGTEYHGGVLERDKSFREQAIEKVMLRMGFDSKANTVLQGSYFENLFGSGEVTRRIAAAVNTAIAGQMAMKDFRVRFRVLFLGVGGMLERHFQTMTYDLFQRIDRATNKIQADKLGLKFAIYSGTVMDTTRKFCREKVNKVFSRKEIESWKNLTWAGRNKFDYDPYHDCGGHRCRHHLWFISDELAKKLKK